MLLKTVSRGTMLPQLTPTSEPERTRVGCGRLSLRIRAWFRSGSEGSAIVEMALALPVMLILMTSIFSFALVTNQKLILTEAVSAGGRVLAVDRGDIDPCKTTANAIYAAAPGLTPGSFTLSFSLNGGTPTGATCAGSNNTPNPNLISGDNAEITAQYPCSLIVYGKNWGTCTLQSQITEVVQ